MGVNPLVNTDLFNVMFRKQLKMDFLIEKLAADKVLTVEYPPVIILDPDNSTRDVDLPAEALSEGLVFFIFNDGAGSEVLVVKDDGGTTITTIQFPENAMLHCDGVKWRGILSKGTT